MLNLESVWSTASLLQRSRAADSTATLIDLLLYERVQRNVNARWPI
jgi:hypothetical protein